MAGFAVNMQLFFDHPDAWFSNNVQRGYQESTILKLLGVTMADLEPRADKCTKVKPQCHRVIYIAVKHCDIFISLMYCQNENHFIFSLMKRV